MTVVAPRQTADERRLAVLDAATKEFAAKGLHGASTEDIAHAAGISQPYLFRLFGTKKGLFLAAANRTSDRLYELFTEASEGKTGADALEAMGSVYTTAMADRDHLMLMLKCWASCDDPEICDVVRSCWRRLVDVAERASGAPPEVISAFFAKGALLTVMSAMDAFAHTEPWSDRLLDGCRGSTAG
jgi:AcrR family transcriptional regulator